MSWKLVESPLSDYCVWAVAIDESDPKTMYAGTGTPDPATIFRSSDGGNTWEKRPVEVAETCPAVGIPRVTGMAIDPENRQDIWVGFEVDGVRRSTDGGDSWEKVNHGSIPNLDIHNVAVAAGPPKTVVVLVNDDVYTSPDGDNWTSLNVKQNFPYGYPRGVKVQPDDPQTIFLTVGDTTPGPGGRRNALQGHGQDLGTAAPAGGPQHRHVGGQHPALRSQGGLGRQPLRVHVPQRRRRRFLGEAVARVQRNFFHNLDTRLTLPATR